MVSGGDGGGTSHPAAHSLPTFVCGSHQDVTDICKRPSFPSPYFVVNNLQPAPSTCTDIQGSGSRHDEAECTLPFTHGPRCVEPKLTAERGARVLGCFHGDPKWQKANARPPDCEPT